ncbi:hypothetical protein GAPWKB11_0808 [Gilliamella apicola]|uniref:hypothetical protein n=1 Tax=Gilliamella sp. wkB18 TaxID=3120260 RepID=UPI0004DD498A|nr:hypothetical protein [Gilliamella apicola]KFA58919.1 hypothetical protein GAPWKB11_0808 [Gilliamella apicola]
MNFWNKYPDNVPEKENGIAQKLCIVRIRFLNNCGELCESTTYDWYDEHAEFDEWIDDYVGEWSEHDNDEITHWIYADEIPLPEG